MRVLAAFYVADRHDVISHQGLAKIVSAIRSGCGPTV